MSSNNTLTGANSVTFLEQILTLRILTGIILIGVVQRSRLLLEIPKNMPGVYTLPVRGWVALAPLSRMILRITRIYKIV